MKWFVAALIMECRVARNAPELWDEQIIVLRARTPDEGYQKAVEAGRAANTEDRNAAGERVRWRYQGLGSLDELGTSSIRSGTEIYSRLSRDARPFIAPKRNLAVFWERANRHRTAETLLDRELEKVAPR